MEEFHHFQDLCEQVVEVSEQLVRCRRRGKTAEALQREVEREVSGLVRFIFRDFLKSGSMDLEAVEMAMGAAMHQTGAAALSQLLRCDPPGPDKREIPCPGGQKARYREMRSRICHPAFAACRRWSARKRLRAWAATDGAVGWSGGDDIYREALPSGWNRAAKKAVIGDGAEWIWNNADPHFPR